MRTKTILLYDQACPMCTFQMRILTWVDFLNKLRLIPYQDPAAHDYTQHISAEDLHASIHCVTPQQRVFRGAEALRHVCMRLPPYLPIALLLWLPGALYIAQHVYDGISRNRMRLSRVFGCKGACSIMPTRQRDDDILPPA